MIKLILVSLLLSPLIGTIINSFRWKNTNVKSAAWIGVTACFISFVSSVLLFCLLNSATQDVVYISFMEWLNVGDFRVSFSFLVDPLSIYMLLVITGVGFLIHLFSIYYISHDARPAKYFAYLNLFILSMAILVLADNLFLMFLGWEAVGFCSYLLIGFWFTYKEKAAAGMKAFIVNRIGDIGFLIGMFLIFQQFSSLQFSDLSYLVATGSFDLTMVKWSCLFFLIGALGKSAQIPLYIWLPSAMAGPTPVSALIHAATMVTAGIYLISRMNFLFLLSPEVLTLMSWIGAITALLTALIACAQSDIKKVLAYSTISQLAYMFVAAGLGAFTASMFHLLTHAFFKALLFLSAGAIIHALNGEQNINRMGGLKKYLPVTWFCFLIGFLALIGLPPFAGFFSKDEILWSAFASGHFGIFTIALVTALLTAFYMTRLYIKIFHGKSYLKPGFIPHEGGFFARFPLIILAVLSCFGGLLGIPHLISKYLPTHPPHLIQTYLQPVLTSVAFNGTYFAEATLMFISTFLVILLVCACFNFYLKKESALVRLKQRIKGLFNILEEGFRVDFFCYSRIVEPILNISYEIWKGVDIKLIQGFIINIQRGLIYLKNILELYQKGNIQNYILSMVVGLVICVLIVLFP